MRYIKGEFDVEVDSDNVRTPGTVEIAAFAVFITEDGYRETDLGMQYASKTIPADGYGEVEWIDTHNMDNPIYREMPEHVRTAFDEVVAASKRMQEEG